MIRYSCTFSPKAAHSRERWIESLAGCESFLDSKSVFVACLALAPPG